MPFGSKTLLLFPYHLNTDFNIIIIYCHWHSSPPQRNFCFSNDYMLQVHTVLNWLSKASLGFTLTITSLRTLAAWSSLRLPLMTCHASSYRAAWISVEMKTEFREMNCRSLIIHFAYGMKPLQGEQRHSHMKPIQMDTVAHKKNTG